MLPREPALHPIKSHVCRSKREAVESWCLLLVELEEALCVEILEELVDCSEFHWLQRGTSAKFAVMHTVFVAD